MNHSNNNNINSSNNNKTNSSNNNKTNSSNNNSLSISCNNSLSTFLCRLLKDDLSLRYACKHIPSPISLNIAEG